MFRFMLLTLLLLAISASAFAQEAKKELSPAAPQAAASRLTAEPAAAQTMTPEQVAVASIQQQRNQALGQVADLQANLAYVQAQTKLVNQYWADYVKGLYEAAPAKTSGLGE